MSFLQEVFSRTLPHSWKLRAGLILALASAIFLAADIRISIKQRDPVEYATGILQLRSRRTAELVNAIEAVSFQFLSNQLLNDTLDSYVSDNERYDVSKWNTIFSEHMEGLAETVPELEDAVFFDTGGESRIPLTMSDSLTRSLWVPVRNAVLDKAFAADGRPVWGILNDPLPSTLLCARLIKRRSDNRTTGVLILLVDPDRLARTVSGFSLDEKILVSQKTDYSLLIDGDGKMLAAVDPSLVLKSAAEVIPGYDSQLKHRLPLEKPGSYKASATIGGQNGKTSFWVVYAPVPDKNWILVSILPISLDAFPILVKVLLVLGFAGSAWLVFSTLGAKGGNLSADPEAGATLSQSLHELPDWYSGLAPKEQTVLLFLLAGKSNKEIASILDIREQTVKNYLHSAYQRIGAQDRVSAVLRMQEAGLSLDSLRSYMDKHPEFIIDSALFP